MMENIYKSFFTVWSWDKVSKCEKCEEFFVLRQDVEECDNGHPVE